MKFMVHSFHPYNNNVYRYKIDKNTNHRKANSFLVKANKLHEKKTLFFLDPKYSYTF